MLFKRRHPEGWSEWLRTLVWPRHSWMRSGQYVMKRALRITATPYAVAMGLAAGAFTSFTPFMGLHFLLAATLHPRAVALFPERPAGSPRNVWRAPIVSTERSVDCIRVRLGGALPVVAEVTESAVQDLGLDGGGSVWVAIKATEFRVAPA